MSLFLDILLRNTTIILISVDILTSDYSLWGLFFLGFAAATILPLGSEWLLVSLVAQGYSVTDTVITATVGNYLGACTTYGVGLWGSDFLITKILRISEKNTRKAKIFYQKWGIWSLLLSWLPIIGDPLCLAAGAFRTRFLPFSVLVFSGKALRYLFIAMIAQTAFTG